MSRGVFNHILKTALSKNLYAYIEVYFIKGQNLLISWHKQR